MDTIAYRTDDLTRWGLGQGARLTKTQVDINFWTLFSAIQALQDHQNVAGVIANISVAGGNMFITLGDGTRFGPFTLPSAQWTFRPEGWLPLTFYKAFNLFVNEGALYLVITDHTSATTFNPSATDGDGHDLYQLVLGPGPYDIGMYFPDRIPDDSSVLLMHAAARSFWLPAGLTDSVAILRVAAFDELLFPVYKNFVRPGDLIGAILFGGSHADVQSDGSEIGSFVFTAAVQFSRLDRLFIGAPAEFSNGPDPNAQGLAVTLAGRVGIFAP
jgi:hypothetical protein